MPINTVAIDMIGTNQREKRQEAHFAPHRSGKSSKGSVATKYRDWTP